MKLQKYLAILLLILFNSGALALKTELGAKESNIVDKTPFLKAVIEDKNKIVLINRPYNWGGGFNMDTLEHFFMLNIQQNCSEDCIITNHKRQFIEKEFIGKDQKILDKYFAKYPTIHTTFRASKIYNKEDLKASLTRKIWGLYNKYPYLEKSHKLSEEERKKFKKYSSRNPNLSDEELKDSVRFLSDILHKQFNMPVIILFDKYDDFARSYAATQLEAGRQVQEDEFIKYGYDLYGSVIERAIYKNPNLYKALIMGTTKIVGMKFWNKLQSFSLDTLFTPIWGDYFGFSIKEVMGLMKEYKVKGINSKMLNNIKMHYGGFMLGKQEIYNPSAIMKMLGTYKAHKKISFDYIRHIPINGDFSSPARRATIQNLIDGKSIDVIINPNISYMDIGKSSENFYGILFLEGYLTASKITPLQNGKYKCRLKIPNEEMRTRFKWKISES